MLSYVNVMLIYLALCFGLLLSILDFIHECTSSNMFGQITDLDETRFAPELDLKLTGHGLDDTDKDVVSEMFDLMKSEFGLSGDFLPVVHTQMMRIGRDFPEPMISITDLHDKDEYVDVVSMERLLLLSNSIAAYRTQYALITRQDDLNGLVYYELPFCFIHERSRSVLIRAVAMVSQVLRKTNRAAIAICIPYERGNIKVIEIDSYGNSLPENHSMIAITGPIETTADYYVELAALSRDTSLTYDALERVEDLWFDYHHDYTLFTGRNPNGTMGEYEKYVGLAKAFHALANVRNGTQREQTRVRAFVADDMASIFRESMDFHTLTKVARVGQAEMFSTTDMADRIANTAIDRVTPTIEKLDKGLDTITNTAEQFTAAITRLTAYVGNATTAVVSGADVVENSIQNLEFHTATSSTAISDFFTMVTDQIRAIFKFSEPSFLSRILDLAVLLGDVLIHFYNRTIFPHIPTIAFRLISIIGLSNVTPSNLREFLSSYFPGGEQCTDLHAEAGDDHVANMFQFMTAVVGSVVTCNIPDRKLVGRITDVLKIHSAWQRATQGTGSVFQKATTYFISFLPQALLTWLQQMAPCSLWGSVIDDGEPIGDFIRATTEILKPENKMRAGRDKRFYKYCCDLSDYGHNLQIQTVRDPKSTRWGALLAPFVAKLDVLRFELNRTKGVTDIKPTPFCVFVTGGPGIGKSVLTRTIAMSLLVRKLNPDLQHDIYTRVSSVKHWDGYDGQPVIMFDDFGQVKENGEGEDDYAALLRLVNTAPAMLQGASIEDKGKYSEAELIIAVTNAPGYFPSDKLMCEGAYFRRRHVCIKAELKPGCQKPRLEAGKEINFDHLLFTSEVYNTTASAPEIDEQVFPALSDFETMIVSLRAAAIRHHTHELAVATEVRKLIQSKQSALGAAVIPPELARLRELDFNYHYGSETQRKGQLPLTPIMIYNQIREMQAEMMTGADLEDPEVFRLANQATIDAMRRERYPESDSDDDSLSKYMSDENTPAKELGFDSNKMRGVNQAEISDEIEMIRKKIYCMTEREEGGVIMTRWDGDRLGFINTTSTPTISVLDRYSIESLINAVNMYANKIRKDWEYSHPWQAAMLTLAKILSGIALVSGGWLVGHYDILSLASKAYQKVRHPWGAGKAVNEIEVGEAEGYIDSYSAQEARRAKRTVVTRRGVRKAQAEITGDRSLDNLLPLIDEQMVFVEMTNVPDHNIIGFFYAGTRMILPAHFFVLHGEDAPTKRKDINLRLTTTRGTTVIKYDATRLCLCEYDIAAYDCGLEMQAFKDRKGLFPKEEELHSFKRVAGLYHTIHLRENKMVRTMDVPLPQVRFVTNQEAREEQPVMYNIWQRNLPGKKNILILQRLEYSLAIPTRVCGSLIMSNETQFRGKIMGMHTAGYRNQDCVGMPISQELLDDFDRAFKGDVILMGPRCGDAEMVSEICTMNADPTFEVGGDVRRARVFGRVKPSLKPRTSEKTMILPSPFIDTGYFPVTHGPAPLSARDHRLYENKDPAETAFNKKYVDDVSPPPKDLLNAAIDGYAEQLFNLEDEHYCQVATFDQALNGDMELPGWNPINMSASPGFPYITTRGNRTGKAYLLKAEEGELGRKTYFFDEGTADQRALKERCVARHDAYKRGETFPTIWVAILKDERRPLEKIRLGQTRQIEMAPMDYQIVHRVFNMAYAAMMTRNFFGTHAGIGMDPESYDWHALWNYLSEVMGDDCIPYGFAVDFSNFDGKVSSSMLIAEARVRNKWFTLCGNTTPEEDRARLMCAHAVAHNMLITRDALVSVSEGMLSGNAETATLNSGVHALLYYMFWRHAAPKGMKDYTIMHKHIRFVTYGDDGIVSVSEAARSFFNGVTFQKFCNETLGMKATSATKGDMEAIAPLEELTFLKRSFKGVVFGNYRAPLMDKATIYNLLNWIRRGPDENEQLEDNVNDALNYAYPYGLEFFNELRTKIIKAASISGVKMLIPQFQHYHDLWSEKYFTAGQAESATDAMVGYGAMSETADMQQQGIVPTGIMPVEVPPSLTKVERDTTFSQPDPPNDFNTLTKRNQLVGVLNWDGADTSGKVIKALLAPWDFVILDTVEIPFVNTLAVKPKVKITVSLTRSDLHSGKLEVIYFPMLNVKEATLVMSSAVSPYLKTNQLATLDISQEGGQDAVFEVDYFNAKMFIENKTKGVFDIMGTLGIRVLNPLRMTAGGSTSVPITIYASFSEIESHVITTVTLPKATRRMNFIGDNAWDRMQPRVGQAEMATKDPMNMAEDQGVVAPLYTPTPLSYIKSRFGEDLTDWQLILRHPVELEILAKSDFGSKFYGNSAGYTLTSAAIPINIRPPVFPMDASLGRDVAIGRWNLIGAPFKIWRGDLRYTIRRFDTVTDPAQWWAATNFSPPLNQDGSTITRTSPEYIEFVMLNFPTTVAEKKAYFTTNSPPTALPNLPGAMVIKQELTDQVSVVEVGGKTAFRFNLNWSVPQTSTATNPDTLLYRNEATSAGTLHIGVTAPSSKLALTGTSSCVSISVSAGDSFRFGHPYFIPTIMMVGGDQGGDITKVVKYFWPDHYLWSGAVSAPVDIATLLKGGIINVKTADLDDLDRRLRLARVGQAEMGNPASSFINLDELEGEVQIARIGQAEMGNTTSNTTNMTTISSGRDTSTGPTSLQPSTEGSKFDISASAEVPMMDNPSDTRQYMAVVPRAINTASCDVYVPAVRLALHHTAQTEPTPDDFGTTDDQMTGKYWCSTLTRICSFTLDKTNTAGSLVWQIPIMPIPYGFKMKAGVPYTNIPAMDYYGLAGGYKFWTGGFKFKVTFASSTMASMSLLVSPVFGVTSAPTDMAQATVQNQIELELSPETREFEFTIPHRSALGMLKVPTGSMQVGETYNDYYTGVLAIYVVRPLVVPSSAPAIVDVNIYMCGDENFKYLEPMSVNLSCQVVPPKLPAKVAQSEMLGNSFIDLELTGTQSMLAALQAIATATGQTATNTGGGAVYAVQLQQMQETMTEQKDTINKISRDFYNFITDYSANNTFIQNKLRDMAADISASRTTQADIKAILQTDVVTNLQSMLATLDVIKTNTATGNHDYTDILGKIYTTIVATQTTVVAIKDNDHDYTDALVELNATSVETKNAVVEINDNDRNYFPVLGEIFAALSDIVSNTAGILTTDRATTDHLDQMAKNLLIILQNCFEYCMLTQMENGYVKTATFRSQDSTEVINAVKTNTMTKTYAYSGGTIFRTLAEAMYFDQTNVNPWISVHGNTREAYSEQQTYKLVPCVQRTPSYEVINEYDGKMWEAPRVGQAEMGQTQSTEDGMSIKTFLRRYSVGMFTQRIGDVNGRKRLTEELGNTIDEIKGCNKVDDLEDTMNGMMRECNNTKGWRIIIDTYQDGKLLVEARESVPIGERLQRVNWIIKDLETLKHRVIEVLEVERGHLLMSFGDKGKGPTTEHEKGGFRFSLPQLATAIPATMADNLVHPSGRLVSDVMIFCQKLFKQAPVFTEVATDDMFEQRLTLVIAGQIISDCTGVGRSKEEARSFAAKLFYESITLMVATTELGVEAE
nr:MAG: polyprotein [Picornavirales sp.]